MARLTEYLQVGSKEPIYETVPVKLPIGAHHFMGYVLDGLDVVNLRVGSEEPFVAVVAGVLNTPTIGHRDLATNSVPSRTVATGPAKGPPQRVPYELDAILRLHPCTG